MNRGWKELSLLLLTLTLPLFAGGVSLPKIFGDHMVLQQGMALPVWGRAEPGERIEVMFGDDRAETRAGDDGRWMVRLPARPAGTAPLRLIVNGEKERIEFTDVLVGEVWLLGGQSNMEWPLERCEGAGEVIASASEYPEIRLFQIERVGAFTPQSDCNGEWRVMSPAAVRMFSGIGCFFGIDLFKRYRQPVGLIAGYWGGTNANVWISRQELEKNFPHYVRQLDRYIAELPKMRREYAEQLRNWEAQPPEQRGRRPAEPGPGRTLPANLFNAMINPVIPYAIRGVLWYQGEANAHAPLEYRQLMEVLLQEWRRRWGQGDFPFFFVQLANYRQKTPEPVYSGWAMIREAQAALLKYPNTGMALAIDVGEADSIHPRNKRTVAERLMLLERARRGEAVNTRGPVFAEARAENGAMIVRFRSASPLVVRGDVRKIGGFDLAGADGRYRRAEAELLADGSIRVSSPAIPQPVNARYAWADNPDAELYDSDGLPAEPFRTDRVIERQDRLPE